jgi:hypothetical protein
MNKDFFIPVNYPAAPFGKYGLMHAETDPFGSYTGVPADKDDMPVQDADDL